MTTINTLSRQPTKLDYASPTQFKFSIIKLPKVEYFCTAATIPGIELGETSQPTPLKNIPVPGDKLTYSNLTMTFLCDEYLENFRQLHGWMVGLGFPQDHNQFGTLLRAPILIKISLIAHIKQILKDIFNLKNILQT